MLRRLLGREIPRKLKIVRGRIQDRRHRPRRGGQGPKADPVRRKRATEGHAKNPPPRSSVEQIVPFCGVVQHKR